MGDWGYDSVVKHPWAQFLLPKIKKEKETITISSYALPDPDQM